MNCKKLISSLTVLEKRPETPGLLRPGMNAHLERSGSKSLQVARRNRGLHRLGQIDLALQLYSSRAIKKYYFVKTIPWPQGIAGVFCSPLKSTRGRMRA